MDFAVVVVSFHFVSFIIKWLAISNVVRRFLRGPWGYEQIVVVESKAKLRLFTFIVNLLKFPFCFHVFTFFTLFGPFKSKTQSKSGDKCDREKEKQKHQVDGWRLLSFRSFNFCEWTKKSLVPRTLQPFIIIADWAKTNGYW